jgi:hypothetical protein
VQPSLESLGSFGVASVRSGVCHSSVMVRLNGSTLPLSGAGTGGGTCV